jgi:hypothetical protein
MDRLASGKLWLRVLVADAKTPQRTLRLGGVSDGKRLDHATLKSANGEHSARSEAPDCRRKRLLPTYLGVHGDVLGAVGADGCGDGRKGALWKELGKGSGRSEETTVVSKTIKSPSMGANSAAMRYTRLSSDSTRWAWMCSFKGQTLDVVYKTTTTRGGDSR